MCGRRLRRAGSEIVLGGGVRSPRLVVSGTQGGYAGWWLCPLLLNTRMYFIVFKSKPQPFARLLDDYILYRLVKLGPALFCSPARERTRKRRKSGACTVERTFGKWSVLGVFTGSASM